MDSLREEKRVITNEIIKGSTDLRFEHIDMAGAEYQKIENREKLMEVLQYLLRISKFCKYTNRSTQNNIYTDFKDILLKKMQPRRTRHIVERNDIYMKISRYGSKVKPDYNGKVYVETVPCYFKVTEEELENWKYTFEGKETYAFLMTNKHLAALCSCALQTRMDAAKSYPVPEDADEVIGGIITMEGVRTCLFQALLMDDIRLQDGCVIANLHTIYVLK